MRRGMLAVGLCAGLIAGVAAIAAHAGSTNLVQGCDPATGLWFQNGQPGETTDLVTGFKRDGEEYAILSENTGTDRNDESVNYSIQCTTPKTRWSLFRGRLGDRPDTARLDAVGLSNPTFGPIPTRIEARLFGGSGPDDLRGHDGRNTLQGGGGDDELRGFADRDRLVGGPASDLMLAGSGSDLLRAADDKRDTVSCGPGEDFAQVDRKDDRTGCETVTVR